MYYLALTSKDIEGLEKLGVQKIYVEVDVQGIVLREVGLDEREKIVHRYPSKMGPHSKYGVLDLVRFDPSSLNSDLSGEDFDSLWSADA